MAKTKDKSELEFLRGLVRTQKSQIKALKREISRYNKRAHLHDDAEEKIIEAELLEEKEEELEFLDKEKCPSCKQGTLEEIELGKRLMIKCMDCTFRKVVKKD